MTWHRPRTAVTLIVLSLLALGATPAFAASGTFSTDTDLSTTGMESQAGPTTVSVSGMSGSISDLTVTLSGVNMVAGTASTDILLVSPSNAGVILFGDVATEGSVNDATWVYNDAGTPQADGSSTPAGSSYAPTNDPDNFSGQSDNFGPPAPTSPYGSTLSSFGGSPNGDWKLYIRTDYDSGPQLVSGWSLSIQTTPDVTPTAKDFATAGVGSTSAPQTFTVKNTGPDSIDITSTAIQGADASQFTITDNKCQGSALVHDATCTVTTAFTPTSAGPKSAALVIQDSSATPPVSIPLTGTATVAPGIAISPPALDFGDVASGTNPGQFITVTNPGSANLNLTLPASPPDFTISIDNLGSAPACGGDLPPGGVCRFAVIFTPTTAGAKSATIGLSDNAPGGPHSINLTGNSLPASQASGPQESGSVNITIDSVGFSNPPAVGQPTTLDVTAHDKNEMVTGLLVDFGEQLGLYGASGCVERSNNGNSATFSVPYEFLTPGTHTVKITVFSGGCTQPDVHTYTFTVDVPALPAARRIADSATTLAGPNITSKCKNAKLAPTTSNGKKIVTALLCVMNEQRALAKLKPYKISKKLTKAALNHTRAMIGGRFFAHQGPREPALSSRLKKVKYRYSGGENIGAGAGSLGSPLMMVNGWMHSSLHKANLLSKRFRVVGIGFIARFPLPTSAKPVATFTADFGAK